jgi:eukaryotic-like serine/threonine-protein kinase
VAPTNPEKVGRYQIIERVGRGGMGVLFRGVDPVLDREVAIKLMLVDFSDDEEQMRPRFYREARAVARLQHRNIVTIFEFAEEGTTPYIVMEFLRGVPLSSRMASPVPLSLDQKLSIVSQLCSALNYAHEQGVVHRDVKPANVFVLEDGTVKLLDFGIAKLTTSTLTQKGDVLGSASYMSPEQVSGSDSVDGRSDIFSAGVVLYELLAGRRPFQAESATTTIVKILHEAPTPLDEVAPGLPAPLVAAVSKALAKDPADRYATAGEFAKELEWIRKGLETSGEGASALDETRFATPAEIKSFQKDQTGRGAAPAAPEEAATAGGGKRLAVAGVAAIVIIGAVAAFMLRSRPAPANTAAPSETAAVAAGAASPGGPAVTPAPAAPPVVEHVQLRVATAPPGAAITLDGTDTQQTTPASLSVTSGSHRLQLSKAGYVSRNVTLADADVKNGSVSYTLEAVPPSVVPVSITSTYPVAVVADGKTISEAAESHELSVRAGTTLHLVAPDYMLDESLKIGDKRVSHLTPALGFLTVLTRYETCNVKIGAKDLGYPPITKLPIVSGQHRVDIVCADGQNPPAQIVTVEPNATVTARIF